MFQPHKNIPTHKNGREREWFLDNSNVMNPMSNRKKKNGVEKNPSTTWNGAWSCRIGYNMKEKSVTSPKARRYDLRICHVILRLWEHFEQGTWRQTSVTIQIRLFTLSYFMSFELCERTNSHPQFTTEIAALKKFSLFKCQISSLLKY